MKNSIYTDLFKKYDEELHDDTKINELNIKDKQMKLAGIKHKWASRLIMQKVERHKYEKLLEEAKNKIIETKKKESHVSVSNATLDKMVEKHEVVVKIKNKIRETDIVILYLEKVEKIFSGLTYDIKNIIDVMKLEQL